MIEVNSFERLVARSKKRCAFLVRRNVRGGLIEGMILLVIS